MEEAESIQTEGRRSFSANGSLERMLRKKLAKSYASEGISCDLLLFYDQQKPYRPFEYLLRREADLTKLIVASVFENIWLFHLPSLSVMGRVGLRENSTLLVCFNHQFHFDSYCIQGFRAC